MKQKILCIIGHSGSGKTLVEDMLVRRFPYTFKKVTSCTTRPMREDELNGREHWFVNPADKPQPEAMLAYTQYGGYEYWADASHLAPPERINTYVIDTNGMQWLKKQHGDHYDIRTLYIRRSDLSHIDPERLERDRGRLTLTLDEVDAVYVNDHDIMSHFFDSSIFGLGTYITNLFL